MANKVPTMEEMKRLRVVAIGQKANALRRSGFYDGSDVRAIKEQLENQEYSLVAMEIMVAYAVDTARSAGIVVQIGGTDAQSKK